MATVLAKRSYYRVAKVYCLIVIYWVVDSTILLNIWVLVQVKFNLTPIRHQLILTIIMY